MFLIVIPLYFKFAIEVIKLKSTLFGIKNGSEASVEVVAVASGVAEDAEDAEDAELVEVVAVAELVEAPINSSKSKFELLNVKLPFNNSSLKT
jgi:hypothetical protein